jgi:hypothetical protein
MTALAVNTLNDKYVLLYSQDLARGFNLQDWERVWIRRADKRAA